VMLQGFRQNYIKTWGSENSSNSKRCPRTGLKMLQVWGGGQRRGYSDKNFYHARKGRYGQWEFGTAKKARARGSIIKRKKVGN